VLNAMIPIVLARALEEATRNALTLRVLRIRFQRAGGTDNELGVANAPFSVSLSGVEISVGQTDAAGELALPMLPGETVDVRIFDTVYTVTMSPSLEAATTQLGMQKRLDVLGYMTGYLLGAIGNDIPHDDRDGPRTRQALLNLQTDRNLTIDATIGPNTRAALVSDVGI